MSVVNKLLRRAQDKYGLAMAILARNMVRLYTNTPTTPCIPSRNKREGRYVGHGTFCGALKVRRVGFVFYEVAGRKHHRVHVREPRPMAAARPVGIGGPYGPEVL